MVPDQAGNRHRLGLGRGEREADILEAKHEAEAGGLIVLGGDDGTVGAVDRGAEQRVGEDVDVAHHVDPRFSHQRHRLAEALQHRGDEEIAAELDQIGRGRLLGNGEEALPHRVEQGPVPRDRTLMAGDDDEEFRRGRGVGTAEDRRRNVNLAGVGVRFGQAVGQRDADGAHRDMRLARGECGQNISCAEDDALDRRIVAEHGDNDIATTALIRPVGDLGAIGGQRLRLAARAIVGAMTRWPALSRLRAMGWPM